MVWLVSIWCVRSQRASVAAVSQERKKWCARLERFAHSFLYPVTTLRKLPHCTHEGAIRAVVKFAATVSNRE